MKVPIPGDWNGEDWQCVKITWPDSPEFWGLFVGILTIMTRGRYWDERTGTITEMQAIAWEIFNRNYPFIDCDGAPIELPDNGIVAMALGGGCGCLSDCEDCMSCCGYNPNAFKIENGIFYVLDFCGAWVSIGETSDAKETTPENNPKEGTPQEPSEWSACGKISSLVDTYYKVLDAAWDNYTSESTFEEAVRASVPEVKMGTFQIYALLAAMYGAELVADKEDSLDAEVIQSAKCAALPFVADTADATQEEVAAVVNSFLNPYVQKYGSFGGTTLAGLWTTIATVVGPKDSQWKMALGASNDAANCDCPGQIGPSQPTASGWYMGQTFTNETLSIEEGPDWTYPYIRALLEHDVYGVVFEMEYASGGLVDRLKPSNDAGTIPDAYDVLLNTTNSEFLALDVVYAGAEVVVFNELFPSGGATRVVSGITTSSVIGNPVAVKNQIAMFVAAARTLAEPASWVKYRWRWIHNVNSPSHA